MINKNFIAFAVSIIAVTTIAFVFGCLIVACILLNEVNEVNEVNEIYKAIISLNFNALWIFWFVGSISAMVAFVLSLASTVVFGWPLWLLSKNDKFSSLTVAAVVGEIIAIIIAFLFILFQEYFWPVGWGVYVFELITILIAGPVFTLTGC